jgi:sugar lactone lactonase YvrE
MLRARSLSALVVSAIIAGCGGPPPEPTGAPPTIEVVREFSDRQLTGVAVSSTGRLFVNFPLWGGLHDVSVAELSDAGLVPYPSPEWNGWSAEDAADPEGRFVCVQSVYVDSGDTLWILDPAAPGFSGVIPGGPKLVAVDLETDTVIRVYPFDAAAAPQASYLNDVRVDLATRTAYMTDSGMGGLVILDLETGAARRALDDHPAMHAEPDVVPLIGGREWRIPTGDVPQIHSDGIALDSGLGRLYVHALTGRRLWAVPTAALADQTIDDAALAAQLLDLGETVVTDGMIVGPEGAVYHSALELDAVVAWRPDGTLEEVVGDPLLSWPDSFALGPDGWLYVTTSRIHETVAFGRARTEPYGLLRIKLGR